MNIMNSKQRLSQLVKKEKMNEDISECDDLRRKRLKSKNIRYISQRYYNVEYNMKTYFIFIDRFIEDLNNKLIRPILNGTMVRVHSRPPVIPNNGSGDIQPTNSSNIYDNTYRKGELLSQVIKDIKSMKLSSRTPPSRSRISRRTPDTIHICMIILNEPGFITMARNTAKLLQILYGPIIVHKIHFTNDFNKVKQEYLQILNTLPRKWRFLSNIDTCLDIYIFSHGRKGWFGKRIDPCINVNELLEFFSSCSSQFVQSKYQSIIFAQCRGHLVPRERFYSLNIHSVTDIEVPVAVFYAGYNVSLMLRELIVYRDILTILF